MHRAVAVAILICSLAAPALVSPAPVRARISPDFVRSVVRAHLSEIGGCYEEGLARRPELEGRVVVRWTVSEDGAVTDASIVSSELGDPGVESCIVASVRRWTFPATGRGMIHISYPFVLRRDG